MRCFCALAGYKINEKGIIVVFIKAENIKCLYKDENDSDAVALENINLEIERGEYIAFI